MTLLKHIVLFLFFYQTITAQQFSLKNITTNNGLSSSEVYDVLQDKLGYMWFATPVGRSVPLRPV
jgi:hypothetical protein